MIQEILEKKLIQRPFYLDKLKKYLHTPLIKVLIGQRRVGKSTLLYSIIQELVHKEGIPKANIFYINKELFASDHITDYETLKAAFLLFIANTDTSKRLCIAIDEIQQIDSREKFINGVLAQYEEKAEIFITGSNSFLLSGELSTYITGRYIEFHIFPLSYTEFCTFKGVKKTEKEFLEHLKYGGLPAIFKMDYHEDPIYPYLLGVYNTIINKDIIQHHHIRNISFFKSLYTYTLSNISNVVSAKSIKDYLRSQKISIGNDTVINFLQYAEETFLLYKIPSSNPETKKIFEIYNKYYAGDLGIRNALVGYTFTKDIGKLLENYVYLELKRQGYEVMIGRLNNDTEVDFIATKGGITKYFQVCYLLGSEKTIQREFGNLLHIHDNREKYVLSLDPTSHGIHDGIHHINIMNLEELLNDKVPV